MGVCPCLISLGENALCSILLRTADLLLRQAVRVLDRLLNVFPLKVRVALQDFIKSGPMGGLSNDQRDGDPHPPDASSPSHALRIEGDAVKHLPCLPFHGSQG